MKLPIRCGVLDGGTPCLRPLGEIELPGFPGDEWLRNFKGLRWDERDYVCPKHRAVQIHEQDVMHAALTDGTKRRRVLLARGPLRVDESPDTVAVESPDDR